MIRKRLILTVHGEVQRVGYRDRVRKIAYQEKITGTVRNLEDNDVEIIAHGEETDLTTFLEKIRIYQYPIFVESIDILEDPETRTFSSFTIIRGSSDEELGERLDTANQYLAQIMVTGEKTYHNTEKLLEKMDTSLERQDYSIKIQESTAEEIKGLRRDISETLDQRLTRVETQLEEMRALLFKAGISG